MPRAWSANHNFWLVLLYGRVIQKLPKLDCHVCLSTQQRREGGGSRSYTQWVVFRDSKNFCVGPHNLVQELRMRNDDVFPLETIIQQRSLYFPYSTRSKLNRPVSIHAYGGAEQRKVEPIWNQPLRYASAESEKKAAVVLTHQGAIGGEDDFVAVVRHSILPARLYYDSINP